MRIPEIGTVVPRPSGPSSSAGTASRSPTRRTSSVTRSSPSRSPRPRPNGCGSRPASPTRTRGIPPRSPTSRRRCRRRRAAASCSASAGATPRCSTSGASRCRSTRSSSRSPTCRPISPTAPSTATGTRAGCSGSTGATQPKVPLDIAVSGPRMIEFAGRIAEQVTLAVGADPDRVAWAIDLAAQGRGRRRTRSRRDLVRRVRDRRLPSRPRRRAATSISGAVAAFAHFSSMPGSTGAGLGRGRPCGGRRGRPHLRQQPAPRATPPRTPRRCSPSSSTASRSSARPDVCAERLRELADARARTIRRHRRELPRRRRAPAHVRRAAHRGAAPDAARTEYGMSDHDARHPRRHGRRRDRARRRAPPTSRSTTASSPRSAGSTARQARTIDADGLLVTPGFVDIHTHYDGQASWGERMIPSSWHGVTTVVVGNCGVGFAPGASRRPRPAHRADGRASRTSRARCCTRGSRGTGSRSPSSWTRSTAGRSTSTSRCRCRTARCACT